MRSWLAVLTALAVLVPACAALATEPDAPMSAAELEALQVDLDLAARRVTRHLEALIERRVERLMVAQLATGVPQPPARIALARRVTARRAPEGCEFEANQLLSCRVLGSRQPR